MAGRRARSDTLQWSRVIEAVTGGAHGWTNQGRAATDGATNGQVVTNGLGPPEGVHPIAVL